MRIVVALMLAVSVAGTAGAETLVVAPGTPLSDLAEKLTSNARVSEVVFEAGVYRGGLRVSGPRGADFSKSPLLIRSADGAKVVFDGAAAVEKLQPLEGMENVYSTAWDSRGGE